MHVEAPETAARSFREFLSHYAMIVLSILTALALEQAALSIEHASEGRRAKADIEQEIRENRAAVAEALQQTGKMQQVWNTLLKQGVAQFQSGTATKEAQMQLLREAANHYGDFTPALRTDAWDAAIANQSVNYLDHADLKRYSQLYSAQKFQMQAVMEILQGSINDLPELSFALLTGKTDPAQTVRLLNHHVRIISFLASNLMQLDDALKSTMAGR